MDSGLCRVLTTRRRCPTVLSAAAPCASADPAVQTVGTCSAVHDVRVCSVESMASPVETSIVWLRDDLRLDDNPALSRAVDLGLPLTVVYILDEESDGIRPLGGAARWWLHHSLTSLSADLAKAGSTLTLRRGPAGRIIRELAGETGARHILWNRRYGGPERALDAEHQGVVGGERP